ncbi:hypothetical protein HF086_006512 [Spodoptera exigua]|uniref:Uncharacterized protein n=1 Tax=Spodoptera exigua TaxID=7107 RepID=A0A922MLK7_SPOEX|nr:hypothetical protein HF086_006512 [Spodoptera exigua]
MRDKTISVLTRAQKKKLEQERLNDRQVVENSSSVDRPDQPVAVEVLKKPDEIVELVFCDECRESNLSFSDIVTCTYVPPQSAIQLNTRSLSTPEVLARDLENLCRNLGIKELLIIKNKRNALHIKVLLRVRDEMRTNGVEPEEHPDSPNDNGNCTSNAFYTEYV